MGVTWDRIIIFPTIGGGPQQKTVVVQGQFFGANRSIKFNHQKYLIGVLSGSALFFFSSSSTFFPVAPFVFHPSSPFCLPSALHRETVTASSFFLCCLSRIDSLKFTMAAAVAAPAVEAAPAPNTRPTRPDEKIFKEELAKAEKEHKASMDKFVCAARLLFSFLFSSAYSCSGFSGSCIAAVVFYKGICNSVSPRSLLAQLLRG